MTQRNPLLSRRLVAMVETLEREPDRAAAIWQEARRDYAGTEQKDPELEAALAAGDLPKVKKIFEDWDRDHRPPPLEDRTLLKKAMKAFRKRLKLTRLDDESRLGVGATTKGGRSAIVGITPPNDYPPEVWQELARQGRLKSEGRGLYSLLDDSGA